MSCCSDLQQDIQEIDGDIHQVRVFHSYSKINEIQDDFEDSFSQIESNSETLVLKRQEYVPKSQIPYAMSKQENGIRYLFAINDFDLLLVYSSFNANSDLIISRILDYLKR